MNLGETILKIVDEIKGFPQKEKNCVVQYIERNQWDGAFEMMCRVIKKEKISIEWETYERIIKIGTEIELDPYVWDDVLFLVKKYLN